jgi:hypothetical protein
MTLRYVVLRHEGIAEPHFDLMFETGADSLLRTWRSNDWPLRSGGTLTKLADHRRTYLDYEGPISGDRGSVRRVASGNFQILRDDAHAFEVLLSDNDTSVHFHRQNSDQWRAE